ncbi:hypothetical protein [Neisseria sp. CCUG12390]|uniref:hypothetical protein n=1 Tax=Neisseria sp. CCUG12390 TaxID=3392035 RepID=UPI003A101718
MTKKTENLRDAAIAGGLYETVYRHGSAGAEFLKGLRGIDYETGQKFDRSLLRIADYTVNSEKNIKQQAGFSAEVASVSKRNAQAIIDNNSNRFMRSEDLAHYGKNNTTVDIVELLDGKELSTSQMKFVSNPDGLLKKIARGEGGGKNDYSRYMSVDKLEVPTEHVETMKATCREQAQKLKEQATVVRKEGKFELADKLEKQSENYRKLEHKITDSGLTTEEAIRYRQNPRWETAKDIAGVSHKAGLEGAKFGAAIGGSISAVSNAIAVWAGDKELGDAIMDTAAGTLKSAGIGYSTAFAGSVVKSYMQQSGSIIVRNLSKTGLPAAVVSVCLSTTKSVAGYVKGEINETELAQEMGLVATGMLSTSTFTMIGQIAIPIPVLGGMIGGIVGYAITNSLYQGFFDALKEAKLSAERRQTIEMQCAAAVVLAKQYELGFKELFATKVAKLDKETTALFTLLEKEDISADEFCEGMNRFAEILGKKISINNLAELDSAMLSDNILII